MQPTDLELLRAVSEPTVHPDGGTAVFAVTRPDFGADSYVGQLWTVPLTDGGSPRRLTRGVRDSAPKHSPDGSLIGFLRAEPGGPPQLNLVAASGGEPVQVTDRKLGVSEFAWSPDGTRLAFVSREPEAGRYGSVEGIDPAAEPARRISTFNYLQNGLGYDIDRRAHVYLVEVPDVFAEPVVQPVATPDGPADPVPTVAAPRKLTTVDTDHAAPVFSPDGRTLAVLAAVHAGRDLDRRNTVLLFDVADAGDSAAAAGTGSDTDRTGDSEPYDAGLPDLAASAIEYGPDGRLYLLASDLGTDGLDFVGRNSALYVIDSLGAPVRRITDPAEHDIGGDTPTLTPEPDGSVLAVEGTRGTHQLVRIDTGGKVSPLTDGAIEVTGMDALPGDTPGAVISYGDQQTFGDLAIVNGAGALRRLTDFSAELREAGLVIPTELTVTGRDGYPVHGWLAVPEGEGPFPVLLMIHGGPFAAYGVTVFDETQVYTGAGYAVAYCNPRGSRGYGEEHGRSIRQQMGTVDLHDVLDFLDGAIAADDRLDGERTGILGGSYGGYLTAWTIAHDHRFAGAIVERGFLDPELFDGTSDIGSFFGQQYVGTDPEQVRAQSPQAHVAQVSTPTLVMHSELDLRCPLSQAERYYAALKRQRTETELVVFPGENHELSRSGRPRHRKQRFELILDWWGRRLPVN